MAILADAPDNSPRDRNSRAKILPAERAALVAAVQSKLDAARDFIRNYLADEHWHPRADLFDLAREWGPRFADRTLRRALESLQDDGEVEQCSRKRVTHLALALRRHQSGNSQQPGLQYYRPDDVAGPRSDLHKRGAAHFGRTADRFLDPEEIVPDYWARHLDDGIWSTNHDFDRREKEKLCLQIVDAYRMKSSKLRFADRRYQSIGEEVCAVIKVGPVVTAIREQSEGREHLYYNEIILPRIHGGERRRWRVALAQTEKRTRDAVAAADPNDAWGGCHAFLGTRPGTGRWRTEILGLLTTHPHPIPDGADQRGWERLPRDEALTLAAKEVLLHGVMSAQPTLGGCFKVPRYKVDDKPDHLIGSSAGSRIFRVHRKAEKAAREALTAEYGAGWEQSDWVDQALIDRYTTAQYPDAEVAVKQEDARAAGVDPDVEQEDAAAN